MLSSDNPMGWKMIWTLLFFVLAFHFITRGKRFVVSPYTVFAVWQNAYAHQNTMLPTGEPDERLIKRLELNAWATDGFLAAYGIGGTTLWKWWRVVITVGWWLCGSLLVTLVGLGALRGQPDHFAAYDAPLYLLFLSFLLLDLLFSFLQAIRARVAGIPFTARARLNRWLQHHPLDATSTEEPISIFARQLKQAFDGTPKRVPWWFTLGNPWARWPGWIKAMATPMATVVIVIVYGLLEGKYFAFSDAGYFGASGFFLVTAWSAPIERLLQVAPWAGYDEMRPAFAVSWMLENFGTFPD